VYVRAVGIVFVCAACNGKTSAPAPTPNGPSKTARENPTQPPSPVEEIALGMSAAVVRLADDSTWTWGRQGEKEPYLVKIPMPIPLGGARGITGSSTMSDSFCGVRRDGTAVCAEHDFDTDAQTWGWNERKQWGRPPATTDLTHVRAIAPSYVFDCVVLDDGTARCWGEFRDSAKDSDASEHFEPVPIKGVSNAIAVTVGGAEACAILADHHVKCWGRDEAHETHPAAHAIAGLDHVIQLASGMSHHCALRDDGNVMCWGTGTDGQIGGGAGPSQDSPVPVEGVHDVVELRCGSDACCVRHRDATVSCWGNDLASPEVGPSHAKPPAKVPGIADAKLLAVGDHNACVVRATGIVSCWGDPEWGVLGEATTSAPTEIRWPAR
jgi:alpha-tubulin suppressor-like RCC1 family protein